VPGAGPRWRAQIVAFVQRCARSSCTSCPASPRPSSGRARCWSWTRWCSTREVIQHTLGVLLKYQDDIAKVQGSEAARMLEQVRNARSASARELVGARGHRVDRALVPGRTRRARGVYNQAVADVQDRLAQRLVAEIDVEIHEDEFGYWRKFDKKPRGKA
jgi:hypothetical protein